MAFEEIECVNPRVSKAPTVPPRGVVVTARKLCVSPSRGGGHRRFIRIAIGAELARAIALTQAEHRLRLLFGTDADAGRIQVSVDNQDGKFLARRGKSGGYTLSINAATAEGLFALSFPAFSEERCASSPAANGRVPHFTFRASPEMLAVED